MLRHATFALAAISTLAAGAPAAAQTTTADSSGGPTLFETRDLYYAGAFAAATVIMAPLDRAVAHAIQDSVLQANQVLERASTGVRLLGSPGALVLGTAVYGTGRVADSRNVAELGLHTTEAVLLADGITGVIKMAAGRARPRLNVDTPFDFRFLGGFQGDSHRSFPSGHTTSAFAAAAAATEEVGQLWPKQKWWVGLTLYSGASLVGVSRVYNNAHWASDVVLGAAIGTFTGWKVVRYAHDHPNNTIDRIFLGRAPSTPGGASAARQGFVRERRGFPIVFTIHTR